MFTAKLVLAVLPFIGIVLGAPTSLAHREDWKDAFGWNGKVTTPAELDPGNASNASSDGSLTSNVLNGGVYFCTDANFSGNCVYVTNFNSGQCVGVGSNFNDDVSSFGPDPGLVCTIYSDAGCVGRATGGIVYPGIDNLADYDNNDAMSSFSCT